MADIHDSTRQFTAFAWLYEAPDHHQKYIRLRHDKLITCTHKDWMPQHKDIGHCEFGEFGQECLDFRLHFAFA